MKTILVPIDFSPISEKVAKEAGKYGHLTGAKVVFLHVVTRPILMSAYGIPANVVNTEIEKEQEASVKQVKHYESLAQKAGAKELASVVVLGPAVESILQQAETQAADLIVLGTHGHGALYNLLMGSTATGILKKATCPVLVIPRDQEN